MGLLIDLTEPLCVRQTRAEIEAKRKAEAPFIYGDADLRVPEPDQPRKESPISYISDRFSLVPGRISEPREGRLLTFPLNRLAVCQPQ